MFYADFVLSKKGPLARIWLAAHWDKKLTKAQIFETNIESSIERILKPKVKLALRTSGHLMLGVVRIYSRKTKYLLADCNEAFVKIKMAFRPGMVDLPEDHREAAVNAVTLPEVFHDFDSAMPDLNDVDIEAQFTLNQSRADEITIREDYGNVPTLHTDDGFGINFDASSEVIIGHSFEGNAFGDPHPFGDASSDLTTREAVGQAFHPPSIFDEEMNVIQNRGDRASLSEVNAFVPGPAPMETDMPKDDEFRPVPGGGLFEAGLFEDAMMPEEHPVSDPANIEHAIASTSKSPRNQRPDSVQPALNDDDDFDDDHFIPPSPGGMSSDGSRPPSPIKLTTVGETASVAPAAVSAEEAFTMPNDVPEPTAMQIETQSAAEGDLNQNAEVMEQNEVNQNAEQTTLLQNEEESFALAPVDASALRGLPKTKRKRKLIVDEVKNISGEEMKAQLSDTSDIVITLDLAPPTKRLMHWKETGGVEKLFALPGKSIPSTSLFKNYQRHLTSKAAPNDEAVDDREQMDVIRDNQDLLDINTPQVAPVPTRRGRKRKQAVVEEEQQVVPVVDQIPAQEVTKKTRMSPPQIAEPELIQHLSTIPEETTSTLPNDLIAPDMTASFPTPPEMNIAAEVPGAPVPSWLPETNHMSQDVFQTPADPPAPVPVLAPVVTAPEENSGAPPPYPNEDLSGRFSEAGDQSRAEPVLEQTHAPTQICPPLSDSSVERSTLDISQQIPAPIANKDMSNLFTNVGYDENDAELLHQDPDAIQNPFNMDDHEINPVTPGLNAGGGVTPWHDADYDNPVSVGPMIEERGVDETVEQFEERLLNKRAGHLYSTIKMRISTGVEITFNDLIYTNAKKQVAQKFYSLLVLKKHRVLELTQEEPYGNILLTKGPNFDDPKL